LTRTRKIELNLGNPKNGWLPIELKSAEFELEFNNADWKKADHIKLNKLTELVTERKKYVY